MCRAVSMQGSLSLDIPLDIQGASRWHAGSIPLDIRVGSAKKRTAEILYGIAKTIENTQQIIKPRFQNQRVAKTIENTKNNKNTKISEPMANESHR